MKIYKILALALLLSIYSFNYALADEAVSRKVLDNGLVVLAKSRPPKEMVTIDISVRAAPKFEGEYLGSGITHLVEHMVFKGTSTRKAGDIEKEIRSYGGLIDGFVSGDLTSYQITVPVKYFKKALALVKDMLMNASFDPGELSRERDVILREIGFGNDDPEKRSATSLFFNSYIRHPYRYKPIGYEALLKSLTRDDLLKYYRARYVPNNTVIAVVGDLNEDEAVSHVEKEFKSFGKPEYGSVVNYEQEPVQLGKKTVSEECATTLSYLTVGFHSTGVLNKDLFAMDVLSMILGKGDNSRLNRSLVEENRIAHSVSAYNYTPEDPGLFVISAVTDADNLEAVRSAISREVEKIRSSPVTDKELESAKSTVLSEYLLSRETAQDNARELCENEIITGNYDFSSRYVEGVKKLTPSDIRAAAVKYLSPDNMTEMMLVPKKSAAQSGARTGNTVPEEKTEKSALPNGITVLVRRDTNIPVVAVTAAFSGGIIVEDDKNNGINNIVSRMLLSGTKKHKEPEIRSALEERGGDIAPFSGLNSFGVNIVVMKKDLPFALEMLKDIVCDSVFPQEELAKEKLLAIASTKEEDDDIFQRGVNTLKKDLFPGHPYGMRYAGEPETVSYLKREDLLNFYRERCVPGNMVISVSGDVEAKEVVQNVSALFKDMPPRDVPKRPSIGLPAKKMTKRSVNMDREQALLVVGFRTAGMKDPDRYTLDVIETLMSGMSGRMFSSIRDRSGLSYTLGCAQKTGLDTGLMLFYVATTKDGIAPSREKLFEEIKLLRKAPISEYELSFAKQEAISSYRMSMQTNAAYAMQSALDELYGIGYDNLYKYEERIKGVTKEDVKNAATKYLDLNTVTEVVIEP